MTSSTRTTVFIRQVRSAERNKWTSRATTSVDRVPAERCKITADWWGTALVGQRGESVSLVGADDELLLGHSCLLLTQRGLGKGLRYYRGDGEINKRIGSSVRLFDFHYLHLVFKDCTRIAATGLSFLRSDLDDLMVWAALGVLCRHAMVDSLTTYFASSQASRSVIQITKWFK